MTQPLDDEFGRIVNSIYHQHSTGTTEPEPNTDLMAMYWQLSPQLIQERSLTCKAPRHMGRPNPVRRLVIMVTTNEPPLIVWFALVCEDCAQLMARSGFQC